MVVLISISFCSFNIMLINILTINALTMKIDYLYEAGPFGSYRNAKRSTKDSLQKLAAEAIFEKYREEIMSVYVNDIKELMDTMVDSKFGGREEKYRICNRYVADESPDAYGVGARIHLLKGTEVIIEQLLSFQTSIMSGNKSYYLCPEEFTFWENEEQKLQEMFPRYTFKIVLDWVYSSSGDLHSRKKVNTDVDVLEHHPFPYPLKENTLGGITLGHSVTLEMFVKYWNRFISKADSVKYLSLELPDIETLDIVTPTKFKTESIQIRGGENLIDLTGASKYLLGAKEITYNLNGFRDFMSRRRDGMDIEEKYKQNPAFERATKGILSLDNLTYLFDNSSNGSLLFSYFTYNLNTGKGRLFDTSYLSKETPITKWFDKDGFIPAVDAYKKKRSKK
jgi:hypothetical protein